MGLGVRVQGSGFRVSEQGHPPMWSAVGLSYEHEVWCSGFGVYRSTGAAPRPARTPPVLPRLDSYRGPIRTRRAGGQRRAPTPPSSCRGRMPVTSKFWAWFEPFFGARNLAGDGAANGSKGSGSEAKSFWRDAPCANRPCRDPDLIHRCYTITSMSHSSSSFGCPTAINSLMILPEHMRPSPRYMLSTEGPPRIIACSFLEPFVNQLGSGESVNSQSHLRAQDIHPKAFGSFPKHSSENRLGRQTFVRKRLGRAQTRMVRRRWNLEGRCKATWKREFKLPWRKAGLLKSSR